MSDDVNFNEGEVIEVNFERVETSWDPQDNIRTTEDIVALLTDGAPSWMTIAKYPFIKGRTDLRNFKDAVLVTGQHITEVINGCEEEGFCEGRAEFPTLYYFVSGFGAWGSRRTAYLFWRMQDWKIARELVSMMWNMRNEMAIHDYYDCPYFGFDPDDEWANGAEGVEADPDLR
jgi:hypothetical protein